MSKHKDLLLLEEEHDKEIEVFMKFHLPLINLFFIPLSYYLLFLINSFNFIEGCVLFFVLLFFNFNLINNKIKFKENKVKEFFFKNVLNDLFSKRFSKINLHINNGLSLSKIKKNKLLEIEDVENTKNKENYITFEKNNIIYTVLNIKNVNNNNNDNNYITKKIDSAILIKLKSLKNNVRFAIRENTQFDYKEDFFKEEGIDLYLTNNKDFDEKYACYTNNNTQLNKFLTNDLIQFILSQYHLNRIELSNNNENLFIFVDNLSFDFNIEYDKEKIDLNKMVINSEKKINDLDFLINNIIEKK